MNSEKLTVACGARNFRIPSQRNSLVRLSNKPGARWAWTLRRPFSSVPTRYAEYDNLVSPVQLIIDPVAGNNAGTYELWVRGQSSERAELVFSVELTVRAKSKICFLPPTSPLFLREEGAELWVRLAGPIGADVWAGFFDGELLQLRRTMYNEARQFPIDWINSRPEKRRLLDAHMIGLEPVQAGAKRWQYVKEPHEEVVEGPLPYVSYDDIYDFFRSGSRVPNEQMISLMAQSLTMGLLVELVDVPLNSLQIDAPENGDADHRGGLWIALGAVPRDNSSPHRPLLAAYDLQIIDPQRSISGVPVPVVDARFREQIWSTFGNTPFTVLNLDVRCDPDRVVVSPERFQLDSRGTPHTSSDCERRHYYLPLRLDRPGPVEASRVQGWYDDVITSICRHIGKGMQFGWIPVDSLDTFTIHSAAALVEHLFLTERPTVNSFAAFALLTFDEQRIAEDGTGRPMVFGTDLQTGQVFPTPQAQNLPSLEDAMKLPQSARLLNNDPDDDNDDNFYVEPQREIDGSEAGGVRNLAIQRKLVSTTVLVWRVCNNDASDAISATRAPLAETSGVQPFHEQKYTNYDYAMMREVATDQIKALPRRGNVTARLGGTLLGQLYRLNASRCNAAIFLRQVAAQQCLTLDDALMLLARSSGSHLKHLGLDRIPDSQDFTFINQTTAEVLIVAPYTLEHVALFESDDENSRFGTGAASWFWAASTNSPGNLGDTLAKTSNPVLGMLSERTYIEARLLSQQAQARHMKAYIVTNYDVTYALSTENLTAATDARTARLLMHHVKIWTNGIKRAQSLLPVGERDDPADASYATLERIAAKTHQQLLNLRSRDALQVIAARAAIEELPLQYVLPIDSGLFPDHITASDLHAPLYRDVYSTPGMTKFFSHAARARGLARFATWCESHAASVAQLFGFSPDQPAFDIGEFSLRGYESGIYDPQRLVDSLLLSNYLFMIRDASGLLDDFRRDEFRFSSSMSIAALALDRSTLAVFSPVWSSQHTDRSWAQLHKLNARLDSVVRSLGNRNDSDTLELRDRVSAAQELFEKIRLDALNVYFSTVYQLLKSSTVPDNLPEIIVATRKELDRLAQTNNILFGDAVVELETLAKRYAVRESRQAIIDSNVTAAIPSAGSLKARASRIINEKARDLGVKSVPEDLRARLLGFADDFPNAATRARLNAAAASKDYVSKSDGEWDETAFRRFVESTFDQWFANEINGPLAELLNPAPPLASTTAPQPQRGMPAVPRAQTLAPSSQPLGVSSAVVGKSDADLVPGIIGEAFDNESSYRLPPTLGGVQSLLRAIAAVRSLPATEKQALKWTTAALLLLAQPGAEFVGPTQSEAARKELAQLMAAEFARLANLVPASLPPSTTTSLAAAAAATRGSLRATSATANSRELLIAQFLKVLWLLRAMRHLSPSGIIARYRTQLRVALYYGLRTHPRASPPRAITLDEISVALNPFVADVGSQLQYRSPIFDAVQENSLGWDPAGTFTAAASQFVQRVSSVGLQASSGWKAAREVYNQQLMAILTIYVITPQRAYCTNNRPQWLLCQQQSTFFRPDRHEPSGLSAAFNTYIGAESDAGRIATALPQSVWDERLRQLNDQISLDEETISGGLNDPLISLGLLDPRRKREMIFSHYTPEVFAQLAISSALKQYEEQGPLTASVVPLGLLGRLLWALISDPEFFTIRQQYGLLPFSERTLSPFQLLAPGWIVRDTSFDPVTARPRDADRFKVMTTFHSYTVFEAINRELPEVVQLADKIAVERYAPLGLVANGRDLWRLVIFGHWRETDNDVYIGQIGTGDARSLTTRDYAELVTFSLDFIELVEKAIVKVDKAEQGTGAINATTKRKLDERDAEIERDQAALSADAAKLKEDLGRGLIAYGTQYSQRQSDINTRQAAIDEARARNSKNRETATRGPIREALQALDRIALAHACFVFVLGYLMPQPPVKPIFVQQLHPDGTLLYDYFSGRLPLFIAQEVYGLRMAKYSTNADYRDAFRRLVGGKLWGPAERMDEDLGRVYDSMILDLNWGYNCRILLRIEPNDNPFAANSALLRGTAFCYADSRRDALDRTEALVRSFALAAGNRPVELVPGGDQVTYAVDWQLEGNTAQNKVNISPYSGLDLESTEEFPEGRDALYSEHTARHPFEPQERYSVYDWRVGRRLFFNPARAAANTVPASVPTFDDKTTVNIWNATTTNSWPYPNKREFIELMPSHSPALRFFELFFDACNPRYEQTAPAAYIDKLAETDGESFFNSSGGLPAYQIDTGRVPEDRLIQRQAQLQSLRDRYNTAVYWFMMDAKMAAATSFYQPKAIANSDAYQSGERHFIVFDESDANSWFDALEATAQLLPSAKLVELLNLGFDDRAENVVNASDDDVLLPWRHPEQQFRAMTEFVTRLETGRRAYREYLDRLMPIVNSEIWRTQREIDEIFGDNFSVSWS